MPNLSWMAISTLDREPFGDACGRWKLHADLKGEPTTRWKRVTCICLRRLATGAEMPYTPRIEFRPDDLASPRATRRTDDLLPKSRLPAGCATA